MIIWFAGHDQTVVGSGTVSFDISDIPWSRKSFEEEKQFLIEVIENARLKPGWEILDYEPDSKMIFAFLEKFKNMIMQLDKETISEEKHTKQLDDIDASVHEGYPKCPRRGVCLYWHGCIVCNDENIV